MIKKIQKRKTSNCILCYPQNLDLTQSQYVCESCANKCNFISKRKRDDNSDFLYYNLFIYYEIPDK